jgi:nucleotidyltransferase substrate binding protein, HI0074 family
MDNFKNIRWRQRFQNLNKAFEQLQRGLAIKTPSDIEQQGIIQSFEFTFELSWKTMRDYLEAQGVACQFPRDVIKQAFQYQLISAGEIWLDMLGKETCCPTHMTKKLLPRRIDQLNMNMRHQLKPLYNGLKRRSRSDW